jgi:pyrroloquinoline quinone biosynthesis protein D
MGAEAGSVADLRVAVADHVRSRQFEDELVLVDLAGGEYYSLNAVGTKIWHAVTAGSTPTEIAAALVLEYEVGHDTMLGDCMELIEQLLQRGLLTRVAS